MFASEFDETPVARPLNGSFCFPGTPGYGVWQEMPHGPDTSPLGMVNAA
ncbi:MAG: hypothetical protein KF861_18235 [Planctomycetaceae bacterium]|nr:hypothetical protein [Planctomycetaceae bacterium]